MRDEKGRFMKGYKVQLGFKHSDKSKDKMSEAHKGKMLGNTNGFKKGMIPWNKGKKTGIIPKTSFKKNDERLIGKNNHNYTTGRSKYFTTIRYGDDWEAIRMLIYKRDNYTCQECGLKQEDCKYTFHVHHIIPFLISLDNSMKNLTTLCPPCHKRVESKTIKQIKMGVKQFGIYNSR